MFLLSTLLSTASADCFTEGLNHHSSGSREYHELVNNCIQYYRYVHFAILPFFYIATYGLLSVLISRYMKQSAPPPPPTTVIVVILTLDAQPELKTNRGYDDAIFFLISGA
jgi:hypothetical protein